MRFKVFSGTDYCRLPLHFSERAIGRTMWTMVVWTSQLMQISTLSKLDFIVTTLTPRPEDQELDSIDQTLQDTFSLEHKTLDRIIAD